MGKIISKLRSDREDKWSGLPPELLALIADRVIANHLASYVRLRAVCTSWRSATTDPRHIPHLPPQLPWLLLRHDPPKNLVSYFSLADHKTHSIRLPAIGDRESFGMSCDGWLVLEDRVSFSVSLLNPLTGDHVHLPPLTNLPQAEQNRLHALTNGPNGRNFKQKHGLIRAIAMSSKPSSRSPGGCSILVILSEGLTLASLRIGENSWSPVVPANDDIEPELYDDAIFFKGRFYAVTHRREILCIQPSSLSIEKRVSLAAPYVEPYPFFAMFWLWRFVVLSSSDELVLLQAVCKGKLGRKTFNHTTKSIEIFKLSKEGDPSPLMETEELMESLRDEVLFLGFGRWVSCPLKIYPRGKPHRIYIAEDEHFRFGDIPCRMRSGVYNLKDERLKKTLPWKKAGGSSSIWHTPSF